MPKTSSREWRFHSVDTVLMGRGRGDPITVLKFLARFTREANIQEMSKVQAFMSLLLFLDGFALSQNNPMIGMTPLKEEGITCFLEAVRYLLTNYV